MFFTQFAGEWRWVCWFVWRRKEQSKARRETNRSSQKPTVVSRTKRRWLRRRRVRGRGAYEFFQNKTNVFSVLRPTSTQIDHHFSCKKKTSFWPEWKLWMIDRWNRGGRPPDGHEAAEKWTATRRTTTTRRTRLRRNPRAAPEPRPSSRPDTVRESDLFSSFPAAVRQARF